MMWYLQLCKYCVLYIPECCPDYSTSLVNTMNPDRECQELKVSMNHSENIWVIRFVNSHFKFVLVFGKSRSKLKIEIHCGVGVLYIHIPKLPLCLEAARY